MTHYISSGKRHKKNVFLGILITITLIGSLATAVLTGGFFYIVKAAGQNLEHIEEMKQRASYLQQQIDTSNNQLILYEQQVNKLNQQLLRFEPIIIPNSMLQE